MPTVRKQATVLVTEAVDGTPRRRIRVTRRDRATMLRHVVVLPEVMAAARAVRRPGEDIVILSETRVELRPSPIR